MSGEWQHGLFGCFDNIGICVITYFVPCYQFGKNAEAVGDSCLLCGLIYAIPFADLLAQTIVRGKIRDRSGISGGMITDLLTVCCCPCCALIQEGQEVASAPGGVNMQRH